MTALPPWLFRVLHFLSFALIAVLAWFPIQSDDFFFYVSVGDLIRASGSLPKVDPFLYSLPNDPWHVNHEWFSFVASSWLMEHGGANGVIVAKIGLILVGFWCLSQFAQWRQHGTWLSILFLVTAYCCSLRMIERSSLVSEILTVALTLFLFLNLCGKRSQSHLLSVSAILFFLWSNTHPGFLLGFILIAFWSIARFAVKGGWSSLKFSVLIGGVSILSSFLNPEGWRVILYPLNALFDPSWAQYQFFYNEWMPSYSPLFRSTPQTITFFALCITTLSFCSWSWFKRNSLRNDLGTLIFASLISVFFTYLGLSAIRFVPTAALMLTAALAMQLRNCNLKINPRINTRAAVVLACLMCAFILHLLINGYQTPTGHRKIGGGIDEKHSPVKASKLVEALQFKGNIFNQHDFGSFLTWAWKDKHKVFYHGFVDHIEFYQRDYLGVNRSVEEFDRITRQYHISMFFLASLPGASAEAGPLLYRILHTRSEWKKIYQDEIAVIFVNDDREYRIAP